MATTSVRKFALSVDPDEIVDFAEKLDYFLPLFKELGFEQVGTYTFRYTDDECMIKAELQSSKDGYYVYLYVQALDEHAYRLQEVAEAFSASVIDRNTIEHGSDRFSQGTGRHEKGTGRYEPSTGRVERIGTGQHRKPGTSSFSR
jgi:hypothetical protein